MDFESFRVNGCLLQTYFEDQGWLNYFEMMDDPTFSFLVKDLRVRVEVYDDNSAALEENQKIFRNEEIREKTRDELGLKAFKEVGIISVVMGVNVTITQGHIANILNLDNIGICALNTK